MAANRTRKNLYKLYLSDDEEYILEEKWPFVTFSG